MIRSPAQPTPSRAAIRQGRSALEIVSTGSTPRRLVVTDDGAQVGSLGNPALDVAAATRASDLIDARTIGVVTVSMPDGDVDLFVHTHAPPPSIIVMGATDVASALVRLAGPLGFHTTVVDGRDRFANRERFPTADALRVGMPSELIAELHLNAGDGARPRRARLQVRSPGPRSRPPKPSRLHWCAGQPSSRRHYPGRARTAWVRAARRSLAFAFPWVWTLGRERPARSRSASWPSWSRCGVTRVPLGPADAGCASRS